MTASFLDLPNELILKIVNLLYPQPLARLRLVSKRMNGLFSPILFEVICLQPYSRPSSTYCASISEDLALGKELVFGRYTRKAKIRLINPWTTLAQQLPWVGLLNSLAPILTNLYSLEWNYWPAGMGFSPQLAKGFVALCSIPTVRELSIAFETNDPFPGFTLKPISELYSLSVLWRISHCPPPELVAEITDLLGRCTGLETFAFKIPRPFHPTETISFANLFSAIESLPPDLCLKLRKLKLVGICVSADNFRTHLRHLRSLDTLKILFNRYVAAHDHYSQICQILLDNDIFLRRFSLDCIHPPQVFQYLTSYSGLERLDLHPRHPHDDSLELVHRFFSSVLPLHYLSLRVLLLGWCTETAWTREISREDVAQLEKCHQLTKLRFWVSVNLHGHSVRTEKLLAMWLEATLRLPRLQDCIIHPTILGSPTLSRGYIYYDLGLEGDPDEGLDEFTSEAVKEFQMNHVVGFPVYVRARWLGS